MRKAIFLLSFFLFVALFIAGCSEVVTCPPEYLVAPSLVSPANWAIVDSLSPTLSWTFPTVSYPYPYPGNTCIPEVYRVKISTGPFFTDDLGFDTSGKNNSATYGGELQPGTEYAWGVRPFSSNEEGTLVGGLFAGYRYFFTGPVCDAASLVAPTLLEPYNGGSVTSNNPSLIWDYPGSCRPDSYRIELDTSPDFTNTDLNGSTGGNPSTRWGPGESLGDCTTYYWRVTPVVGDTVGPTSETFTFSVNVGGSDCTPRTFITGTVWQEYCAIPDGPLPDPLPFGCVATSGGGATGNGFRDPGEPGISNVVVRIGSGSCPSANLGVTLTDSQGEFLFQGLEAGTYCISVNVNDNTGVLIPGGFTYPADSTDSDIAYHEVTIADEDLVRYVDYGWLYQFGPTTPIGEVTGTIWHDECRHTGDTYTEGTEPEGCVVYTDGTVHGNGMFESDEEGIAGLWVGISEENCEATPFAYSKTDDTGKFYFIVEANPDTVKDYCLTVQSTVGTNSAILGEGLWTYPWMYEEAVAKRMAYVWAGEIQEDRDFGWDYLHLPIESIGPIFEYPKFHIDLDIYCRAGPDQRWQAWAMLEPGMEFEIEGLDRTRNWALISPSRILNPEDFPNTRLLQMADRCWVMLNGGTQSGDLSRVPLLSGPTLPTETPTATPTPKATTDPCKKYKTVIECQNAKCHWTNPNVRTGNYCESY